MPLSIAIQTRLTGLGMNAGMPGWQIIENAHLLPPIPNSGQLFGDPVAQTLRKLMQSFYDYGRTHWTWAMSAGGAAADGGLVKGGINAVACASFNLNFKWLADQGLGITGLTTAQITCQFITMPGGVCIDSKWVGNVCTSRQPFATLKCFKFKEHYWLKHSGLNYDVCYNRTFGSEFEIVWTKLLIPTPADLDSLKSKNGSLKGGLAPNQLYKLEKPLPEGDFLVMLQQLGPNGWPSWQITPKAQLKALK